MISRRRFLRSSLLAACALGVAGVVGRHLSGYSLDEKTAQRLKVLSPKEFLILQAIARRVLDGEGPSADEVEAALHAKNGSSVRLVLGEKKEKAIGLKAQSGGWKLELAKTDAEIAEVVDVTTGVTGMKWEVALADGAIRFDERFRADHAYRVEILKGQKSLGAAFVYLYPPKVAQKQRVKFEETDLLGDGEMATLPTPTL